LPLDGMTLEVIPSAAILPGQLEGENDAGAHRDHVPVQGWRLGFRLRRR
jgi:hypothetical protein